MVYNGIYFGDEWGVMLVFVWNFVYLVLSFGIFLFYFFFVVVC